MMFPAPAFLWVGRAGVVQNPPGREANVEVSVGTSVHLAFGQPNSATCAELLVGSSNYHLRQQSGPGSSCRWEPYDQDFQQGVKQKAGQEGTLEMNSVKKA